METVVIVMMCVFVCQMFGGLSACIGEKKGIPRREAFAWGFLLPVIGLVYVTLSGPRPENAVRCKRCGEWYGETENENCPACGSDGDDMGTGT